MAIYYPPPAFHFKVSIEVEGAGDKDTRFQEVSGIGVEISTEELVEGGENRFAHQLPTGARHGNLVLKRGLLTSSKLIKWVRDAVEKMAFSPVTVIVTLLDKEQEPLASWQFINAWPVKWTLGNLNSTDNSVLVETLELTYQYQRPVNV
jgi:phage tail-like protein